MIVVADTSPLNYLIRSGFVWILPELFGKVLVPQAVLAEMLHAQAPAEVRSFATSPPTWLECAVVGRIAPGLDPSLGYGEREAISLALETHADALLIDDLAGRREAQSRQIAARGTLAILLQASLRGHLDFPTAFEKLKQLGFRASQGLEAALFEAYRKGQPG
jgi:predicted nucleic acid-binding protein